MSRRITPRPMSRREFLQASTALIAGAGLLRVPRFAPSVQQTDSDPIVTKVNQMLDTFMQRQAPVGLALAIMRSGGDPSTSRINNFFRGEISRGSGQTPDANTIFELGSLTKTFTATLLAYLVYTQGTIKLDDDVQPYFDKLAPGKVTLPTYQGQTIKFWHLASHTAGFPDDPPNLKQGGLCKYTPALMYSALDSLTLPQAPGAVALYSNLGFGTLADVLCLISGGRPYEAVIQEFLTNAQLNMPDTHVTTADFSDPRFAQGYYAAQNGTPGSKAPQCMPTWPAFNGAGSLHATLTDVTTWVKFNLGQTTTSPMTSLTTETIKPLHAFGTDEQVGLAWQLRPLKAKPGLSSITKNGETLGFSTDITYVPQTQTAVIALTNGASVDVTSLDAQIIEVLNS